MKTILLTFLALIVFSWGCTHKAPNTNSRITAEGMLSLRGSLIADTITYDVIIHNSDPEDQWTTECLKNLKHKVLIDSLFDLVYSEKLTAYDFFSRKALNNKDIRELETKSGFSRDKIGKIQFAERWYFDKSSQKFQKEVLSLVLGYELFNENGSLRGYKPIFKIYLKH